MDREKLKQEMDFLSRPRGFAPPSLTHDDIKPSIVLLVKHTRDGTVTDDNEMRARLKSRLAR